MTITVGIDDRGAREAVLRARLHALLGVKGSAAHLGALHQEAADGLGPGHHVTLLVECKLNIQRGLTLPVEDSLALWTDLVDRASCSLAEGHPTLMAIRSEYARCLSRRGQPGDLDRVVEMRRQDVDRCINGGVGDDWTGAARADLAAALTERARYGPDDPGVAAVSADADLSCARILLDDEIARRTDSHGPDHRFTWNARTVQCELLLALAERCEGEQRRALGMQALSLAEAIGHQDWHRSASHTASALHGQVLRAEALLVLDRPREAESEARLAAVLARGYRDVVPGRALLALARSCAVRDPAAALDAANQALNARLGWFSEQGCQVAEAQRLVARLQAAVRAIVPLAQIPL
jgi:hypothetical protein